MIVNQALLDRLRDGAFLRTFAREAVAAFLRRAEQRRLRLRIAPDEHRFVPDPSPHFHVHPELFLQLSGSGQMELAGGPMTFGIDDAILIPRGIAHEETRRRGGGPYLNLVFAFSDRAVVYHATGHLLPPRARILGQNVHRNAHIDSLSAYLDDAAVFAGGSAQRAVPGLMQAHLALLLDALDPEREVAADYSPLVERARHLSQRYLSDTRMNVAWLAERCGCSADYLSHRYQEETGMSLTAAINARRLDFGEKLLADSRMQVGQVARACGYTDPGYFTRVFRRRHGVSPRAWRRRRDG